MLILHVTYTMKPGAARQLISELELGPAPTVRAEDGNICYDYFYSAANPDQVLLVEKWRDEAALSAHLQTSNMATIRTIKEKYVENTRMEKYDVQD